MASALPQKSLTGAVKQLKVVLVPVATIGCGKTTTALILQHLMQPQVSVISNDDIPSGKTAKKVFIKRCLEQLKKKNIVVMDRNNHMYRERQQIFTDFEELRHGYLDEQVDVKFVCLNYLAQIDSRSKELWDITTKRVISRGDKHQSIRVVSDGEKFVKGIMSGFVSRFQRIDLSKEPDSLFDLCINLKVTRRNDSSLNNAKLLYDMLIQHYPELQLHRDPPSEAEWLDASNEALSYEPVYKKSFKLSPKTKDTVEQSSKSSKDIVQFLTKAKPR
jgi:tRNA ligase